MKKIGRPRIIESPEEMDRLVEEYVTKCREEEHPLTLTGMILHMGLSSRQSLDRYEDRPEFRDSVKSAKLLIENGYEVDLRKTGNPAGSIFALKNFGWSDRQEVQVSGGLTSKIDINSLPDALVARIAAGENVLAVLASGAEQGLAALQPYLKEPLALPPAASTQDGGDAAGPPHPADRATGEPVRARVGVPHGPGAAR